MKKEKRGMRIGQNNVDRRWNACRQVINTMNLTECINHKNRTNV